MKFRRIIFSIFLLIFVCINGIAQTETITDIPDPSTFKGKQLSDYVYNELTGRKISARQLQLCRTEENNFPYNIIIQYNGTADSENTKQSPYDTILFLFNQDNILNHLDFIESFCNWCNQQEFNFNISIVLTACDKSQISGNDNMTGTEVFASMIQGSESYCAVYTNLDAEKINTITPGSGKMISPLWLVSLVNEILEENQIKSTIKGSFYLSLYKLDILRSSRILASLLTRNIPAVEISLRKADISDERLTKLYKNFVTDFSKKTSFREDTHYTPIKLFGKTFWIIEHLTIVLLLILITLSLISICDLGFIFRKGHSLRNLTTKRALRTLYLVPITIIILTLCLQLAQFPARLLNNTIIRNPLAVLGIKVIVSFVLISLFYLLELRFHKKADSYTYEYLLRLSSLLNVFLFSAIDISLFYLFATIYIIVSISLHIKNSVVLYIFFILSLLPYIHLIYTISIYSSITQLMPLLFANPLYNLILSCAITPLSIILLRIFLQLTQGKIKMPAKEEIKEIQPSESDNFSETDNSLQKLPATLPEAQTFSEIQKKIKKRFPFLYILIIAVTIVLLIGIIFGSTKLIQNNFKNNVEFNNITGRIIDSPENQFLLVSYKDSNYYGGTIRQLFINTQKPATRVEIFVSGESENPIYYTTYTFSPSDKDNQIKFDFPDFPPERFTVNYTPDNSAVSIIDIYAYYDSDFYPEDFIEKPANSRRKVFIKEKTTILISTNSTGKKLNE